MSVLIEWAVIGRVASLLPRHVIEGEPVNWDVITIRNGIWKVDSGLGWI